MSRRGHTNADRRVRGPTSALTSFLAEQGITARNHWFQRNPQQQPQNGEQEQQAADQQTTDEATAQAENTETAPPSVNAPVAVPVSEPTTADTSTKSKRKKKPAADDKDDDGDNNAAGPAASSWVPRRAIPEFSSASHRGHISFCSNCKCRFLNTNQTTANNGGSAATDDDGVAKPVLCPGCFLNAAYGRANGGPAAGKVRRKRVKRTSTTFNDDTAGESGSGTSAPRLGDMCISLVTDYIHDLETLGDIGIERLDRIARVICKQRQLTNDTVRLFLEPTRTRLHLFDCTRLDEHGLASIAMFCPRLEDLHLDFCGRMTTSTLEGYAQMLTCLSSLTLLGPFLVTDEGFAQLFVAIGDKLKKFSLSQSARFSEKATESLVSHCRQLEELRLAKCGSINNKCVMIMAGTLKNDTAVDGSATATAAAPVEEPKTSSSIRLEFVDDMDDEDMDFDLPTAKGKGKGKGKGKSTANTKPTAEQASSSAPAAGTRSLAPVQILEISDPGGLITDDAVIALLDVVGSGLTELNISDNPDLTDRVLIDGILQCCNSFRLTDLDISTCNGFTPDGISALFDGWTQLSNEQDSNDLLANGSMSAGLYSLCLARCTALTDATLASVLRHSGSTLTKLDIHSCDLLTEDGVAQLAGLDDGDDRTGRHLEELDLSFVRAACDTVLDIILQNCPRLEVIMVWGCNRVTEFAPTRQGLRYTGRECDTL
ncbi:RNI-like protein [Ramicandelaber brevisporus]|nr:RNI-like protein [Ramicandelaber brevisporus]